MNKTDIVYKMVFLAHRWFIMNFNLIGHKFFKQSMIFQPLWEIIWSCHDPFSMLTKDKPTSVGEHCPNKEALYSLINTQKLVREFNWTAAKIKTAISIDTRAPLINQDQGAFSDNDYCLSTSPVGVVIFF